MVMLNSVKPNYPQIHDLDQTSVTQTLGGNGNLFIYDINRADMSPLWCNMIKYLTHIVTQSVQNVCVCIHLQCYVTHVLGVTSLCVLG